MDASKQGLGEVLSQLVVGEEHPSVYLSRKLTLTEINLNVESEYLAKKWALQVLVKNGELLIE